MRIYYLKYSSKLNFNIQKEKFNIYPDFSEETCVIDTTDYKNLLNVIPNLNANDEVFISYIDIILELYIIKSIIDKNAVLYIIQGDFCINKDNFNDIKSILDMSLNRLKFYSSKVNRLGRPKAEFPSNWNIYFKMYMKNEITSTQFMNYVKLKPSTFFKLLKEAKLSLKN